MACLSSHFFLNKAETMAAEQSAAATKRVATLLNAISDLHEGDLLAVLKLVTPLPEYDEDDWIDLGAEGVCIFVKGQVTPRRVARPNPGTSFGVSSRIWRRLFGFIPKAQEK